MPDSKLTGAAVAGPDGRWVELGAAARWEPEGGG